MKMRTQIKIMLTFFYNYYIKIVEIKKMLRLFLNFKIFYLSKQLILLICIG